MTELLSSGACQLRFLYCGTEQLSGQAQAKSYRITAPSSPKQAEPACIEPHDALVGFGTASPFHLALFMQKLRLSRTTGRSEAIGSSFASSSLVTNGPQGHEGAPEVAPAFKGQSSRALPQLTTVQVCCPAKQPVGIAHAAKKLNYRSLIHIWTV